MAIHAARIWLGATACLALSVPRMVQAQAAEDQAAAEALFQRGKKLMADRNFPEACPAFANSHRLDPAVGTLMNLGDCYEQAGKTASAWATFKEAAVAAKAKGQTDRERVARRRAAALEPKLAHLVLEVAEEGASPAIEVKRDGTLVPTEVWGVPLPVDPGEHTIEASAARREGWSQRLTIEEGRTIHISVPALKETQGPAEAPVDRQVAGRQGVERSPDLQFEAAFVGTQPPSFVPVAHNAPCDVPDVTTDDLGAFAYGLRVGGSYRIDERWGVGLVGLLETDNIDDALDNGPPPSLGVGASGRWLFNERLGIIGMLGVRTVNWRGIVTCDLAPSVSEEFAGSFLQPLLDVGGRVQLAGRTDGLGLWLGVILRVVVGLGEHEGEHEGDSSSTSEALDSVTFAARDVVSLAPYVALGVNF